MHLSNAPVTDAGLLISLVHALPDPDCSLGRRARKLAAKLARGHADRASSREAASLTADLLEAADAGLPLDADGLLDGGFDD